MPRGRKKDVVPQVEHSGRILISFTQDDYDTLRKLLSVVRAKKLYPDTAARLRQAYFAKASFEHDQVVTRPE